LAPPRVPQAELPEVFFGDWVDEAAVVTVTDESTSNPNRSQANVLLFDLIALEIQLVIERELDSIEGLADQRRAELWRLRTEPPHYHVSLAWPTRLLTVCEH
jgi:hypothetical protein